MTHRIPNTTVALGRALELVTVDGNEVTTWDEVDGWHMLTTPNAEELTPGRSRLFLVPGEFDQKRAANPDTAAGRTYAKWHDRDADFVGDLDDLPEGFDVPLGRALRVDYSSDKWNNPGKTVEYTHDFENAPPLVYAAFKGDPIRKPVGFVLIGGDMAITPEGIA